MTLQDFISTVRARLENITPGKWVAFTDHGRILLHSEAIPIAGSNYAHEQQNLNDFALIANAPIDLNLALQIIELQAKALEEISRGADRAAVLKYISHLCQAAVAEILK